MSHDPDFDPQDYYEEQYAPPEEPYDSSYVPFPDVDEEEKISEKEVREKAPSKPDADPEPEKVFELMPVPETDPEPTPAPLVTKAAEPKVAAPAVDEEPTEAGSDSVVAEGEQVEVKDKEESSPHARRRRTAVLALAGVLGAGLVLGILYGSPGTSPGEPEAVRGNAVPAPVAPEAKAKAVGTVDTEVQRAKDYQAAHDTFVGFESTLPGSHVAASEKTVVISAVVNGQCTYAGAGEGVEEQVLTDDTGSACQADLMEQTQEQLQEAETQTSEMNQASASSALATAGQMAQYYAMRNFVDTKPSFEGLPEDSLGDGVKVASNTGTSVVLKHTGDDTSCYAVTVTWDTVSDPRGC